MILSMLVKCIVIAFVISESTAKRSKLPGNLIHPQKLEATSTCGSPTSTSCSLNNPPGPYEMRKSKIGSKCYNCTYFSNIITNIIREDKSWWQSANNVSEVNVTIFLKQKYYISALLINIGSGNKPRQWILEKSVDDINFTPWRVFGEENYCKNFNRTQTANSKVHCTSQFKSSHFNDNNEIIILLSDSFCANIDLTEWLEASAIRLRLQKFETFHGNYIPKEHFERFLYYTIRYIEIYGENSTCIGYLSSKITGFKNFPSITFKRKDDLNERLNLIMHRRNKFHEDLKNYKFVRKYINSSLISLNYIADTLTQPQKKRYDYELFINEFIIANSTLESAKRLWHKHRASVSCLQEYKCRLGKVKSALISTLAKIKESAITKKLLGKLIALKDVLINHLKPSMIQGNQIALSMNVTKDDYVFIYNDLKRDLYTTQLIVTEIERKIDNLTRMLNHTENVEVTRMLIRVRKQIRSVKPGLLKRDQMRAEKMIQDMTSELNKIRKSTLLKSLTFSTTFSTTFNTTYIHLNNRFYQDDKLNSLKKTFNDIFETRDDVVSGGQNLTKFILNETTKLMYKKKHIFQQQGILEDKLNKMRADVKEAKKKWD